MVRMFAFSTPESNAVNSVVIFTAGKNGNYSKEDALKASNDYWIYMSEENVSSLMLNERQNITEID